MQFIRYPWAEIGLPNIWDSKGGAERFSNIRESVRKALMARRNGGLNGAGSERSMR